MRLFLLSNILILLSFISCHNGMTGYEKYQSFDEYSLKGIATKEKLRFPYVYAKIKKDTLYLYENNPERNLKTGCLSDIIKLNSLGEFDLNNGKSVIKWEQIDNNCL